MLRSMAIATAVLSVGTLAHSATLLDFGTDPGQVNNTTAGFSIWGGYPAGPIVRAFTADTAQLTYAPTAAWQTRGEQYRGALFGSINLSGVTASDVMEMDARFIIGSPAPDYYVLDVSLLAVDGSSATYRYFTGWRSAPTPFSYGTDPASVPFTKVSGSLMTGATFDFAADTLSGIDIKFQNGNVAGTTMLELDSISIQAVPEPATLGMLVGASAMFLRRRRA